jgi:hypothetical protein
MSLPAAADEKIESSHQLTEINCCMLSAAFRVVEPQLQAAAFQVDNLQLLANHQWLSKSFFFLYSHAATASAWHLAGEAGRFLRYQGRLSAPSVQTLLTGHYQLRW